MHQFCVCLFYALIVELYVQKTTFRNMFVHSVWVLFFFNYFYLPERKNVEKDCGSKIAGTQIMEKTGLPEVRK